METMALLEVIKDYLADCPRSGWSKTKIIVEAPRLTELLEKLRLAIQTDSAAVKKVIVAPPLHPAPKNNVDPQSFGAEGEPLVRQARDAAKLLRRDSEEYADNVLNNLQIVINKMARTLQNGRERLQKYREDEVNAS
ncbi:hypothetical protein NO2_1169 [Candidatus Termititenax persephonae]|uniref:Uncharacterized protein n=1 Tax=Candidatus Termititenax persephonae TaxID=2218525 RepID=A0A388THM4_9BACT|nr:hypothetical protein NO2_1169 [Candidatus Termititenax persephonae]